MGHKVKLDFLTTVSPKYAREIIDSYVTPLGFESLSIKSCLGRVLASDLISPEDLPYFDRSLVDGYAMRSKDSQGASETNPLVLWKKGSVRVGELPKISVSEGECVYVSTGAYVPSGADSVIMQEFTREMGDVVEIMKPVYKGENIVRMGEDIKKGDIIFKKGKRITVHDIGIFAALGLTKIPVFKKPKVAIISTGDEIVSPDEKAGSGKIRDINGYLLDGLFTKLGGETVTPGIAKDEIEDVVNKLSLVKDCDIFCVSGGSSKGERDVIAKALEKSGGRILFHGVNIRPGKPFLFGLIWDKPFFGLPGHPLSCLIVTYRFVVPFFLKVAGCSETSPKTLKGVLITNVPSSQGIEEYVNVRIIPKGREIFVEPIFAKSAVISVLTFSCGYIVVDENREGYEKGEEVDVYFYES
ncbi:MAG: molybdopterin molybdotransferase MoeA [Desulfobacterota bacterium]|nr:molybdopterin molybdotransferase MoeA [Thermodesulfobacteriota bacterium]MDW8002503.1 molybdopterin molybdotransferase MoeA [Deltaproteobacteria bacterium]